MQISRSVHATHRIGRRDARRDDEGREIVHLVEQAPDKERGNHPAPDHHRAEEERERLPVPLHVGLETDGESARCRLQFPPAATHLGQFDPDGKDTNRNNDSGDLERDFVADLLVALAPGGRRE